MNNTVVLEGSGTSRVLDDFQIPAGVRWNIAALFSNDIAQNPIAIAPFSRAEWSIRTGVGVGNFGHVLYSGTAPVTITPTGRLYGDAIEYTVLVSGLSVDLGPGVYFMAVSPITQSSKNYSVVIASAANSVGLSGPNGIFQEFHDVENGTPVDIIQQMAATGSASMGVIGMAVLPPAPVPALSGWYYAFLAAVIMAIGIVAIKSKMGMNA